MQIQVHDINAEISGTNLADQGVHVGAVHVEQSTLRMHDFGNLMNLLLEYSQGIGVGEHECGDFFIHLRGERDYIHHASGIGLHLLNVVSHHGCGCGIGAVSGVGNEDFLPGISFGLLISPHHQQTSKLAVRAGGGL